MNRSCRSLFLAVLLLVALPAVGQAARVRADIPSGTITFEAALGETNTAVIVEQGPGTYFVGDQSPGVMVTTDSPLSCFPSSLPDVPNGFICTVPGATSLVENLGDANDTGVIGDTAGASSRRRH